ncbi:bestrophin [Rhizobium rhizosphaerae]|uniref:Bestrophin n=1 Tax=Xaviernesmea rhizosphaerae TaxID=1672749 RepID=A0A1Q9AL76_9HYPH|nr:bestrophin family protein [Xaviernesmea rhizosphaerae]OLP56084.1 bestrophin [Xaviernesmea rhizosphaerae]
MIVRPNRNGFLTLFALRGSILPAIAPRLIVTTGVACLAVVFSRHHPSLFSGVGLTPFTLIGLTLSIFMSFRNSACFARWWESRQLWGAIVTEMRSMARQLGSLSLEERRPMLLGLLGFAHGLAARLRGHDEAHAIAAASGGEGYAGAPNPTDAVLRTVGLQAARLNAQGRIGDIALSLLETRLGHLSAAQAGCERIATTPLPFSYSLLMHRTATIFCLLLPFALAGTLGWWSPAIVFIMSYTLFGLDRLGDELENPFGTDMNDLPLDALVRVIERDLLHAAELHPLPPPLEPKNFVLS